MDPITEAFRLAQTRSQLQLGDVRPRFTAQPTVAEIERAKISAELAAAFAHLSRVNPPQVSESIELLWRNAKQRRDTRDN